MNTMPTSGCERRLLGASWLATLLVSAAFAGDCYQNGIPDKQDIAAGTSLDCDMDGVPGECLSCLDPDGNCLLDQCKRDLGNGVAVPHWCSNGGESNCSQHLAISLEDRIDLQSESRPGTDCARAAPTTTWDDAVERDHEHTAKMDLRVVPRGKVIELEFEPLEVRVLKVIARCLEVANGDDMPTFKLGESGGTEEPADFDTTTRKGTVTSAIERPESGSQCQLWIGFAKLNPGSIHARDPAGQSPTEMGLDGGPPIVQTGDVDVPETERFNRKHDDSDGGDS